MRITIDGVAPHRPVDEDRRGRAQDAELPVQAAGREHDEPVHLVGQGPGGPDLLLGVLAGVDEEELQVGLAGGPPGGPDQGGEVGVGDVGHDHGDVAGAAGDEAPGGPVGDEVELARPRPRCARGSPGPPARAG